MHVSLPCPHLSQLGLYIRGHDHTLLNFFKSHKKKPHAERILNDKLKIAVKTIPDRCWAEFVTYVELISEGVCGDIHEYQVQVPTTGLNPQQQQQHQFWVSGGTSSVGLDGTQCSFWEALLRKAKAKRASFAGKESFVDTCVCVCAINRII